jgi:L-aspartate oxidase
LEAAMKNSRFKGFGDPGRPLGPGDIVVIGAGLAGLFTALRLAPLPVTVIAAAPLGEGASSAWAQGGIAAAVGEGDTPEAHARDTIAAGAGLVDEGVARFVAEEAPDRVRDLLAYGVPFDRDLAGHYVLSREAAHTAKRIVRVSGDRAGQGIMQALIAAVRKSPQIRVLEGYEAEDLVTDKGRVTGVRLIHGTQRGGGSYELIPAAAVVLATGGASALFAVTTNPVYARGEAIAFAARAGAVIADAEFVQFHPTAIDVGADPAPLATEALRGEGATLVNSRGERFMAALHEGAELAPRDVVARGVFAEITAGRGAFLDCRDKPGAHMRDAFPTVYGFCKDHGIDPVRDPIPVAPAAHYHMGGVATDSHGRTSVEGLWAAGEVASTGLHGANRLASNSLLEAAVFGARVADDIKRLVPASHAGPIARLTRVGDVSPLAAGERAGLVRELRALMTANVGVVRTAKGLKHALAVLDDLKQRAKGDSVLSNMIVAARFIAGAALLRKESRGGHYRSDYPEAAEGSARSFITLADVDRLAARLSRHAHVVTASAALHP